jgi:hypothetical protein
VSAAPGGKKVAPGGRKAAPDSKKAARGGRKYTTPHPSSADAGLHLVFSYHGTNTTFPSGYTCTVLVSDAENLRFLSKQLLLPAALYRAE